MPLFGAWVSLSGRGVAAGALLCERPAFVLIFLLTWVFLLPGSCACAAWGVADRYIGVNPRVGLGPGGFQTMCELID